MNVGLDVFQGHSALLCAAAQRTKQVPLKVEQTGSGRTQTDLEHESPGLIPIVSQLVRADACDCEVVAVFDEVEQALGDGGFLPCCVGTFNIR